jgi:Mn2+/Fe2+ NRAMP family transporter
MEKTLTPLLREIEVPMRKRFTLPIWLRNTFAFLSIIGPGIITASADNDAPGIATYSVAGSKYGYSFIWRIFIENFG